MTPVALIRHTYIFVKFDFGLKVNVKITKHGSGGSASRPAGACLAGAAAVLLRLVSDRCRTEADPRQGVKDLGVDTRLYDRCRTEADPRQ